MLMICSCRDFFDVIMTDSIAPQQTDGSYHTQSHTRVLALFCPRGVRFVCNDMGLSLKGLVGYRNQL